jgi:endonuclease/exonuclease/phosphatase (EEP) superfamily protein YafD
MGVVVWVLVTAVAGWAAVRLAGLERGLLMVQLIAFTPYVAAGSLVPFLLAIVTGHAVAAGVAGVACVGLGACVAPRMVGHPSTRPGVPVRVMAMNLRIGLADAKAIVDILREREVDVLTVQEFTPEAAANLAGAGVDDLLPYQELAPRPHAPGSGLYSRFPIARAAVTTNPGWGLLQVAGTLEIPGARPVTVHSVHPDAPVDGRKVMGTRAAWVEGQRAQPPGGGRDAAPRILAGDFNSTVDHAELRRLLATGYRDAAIEVGRGLLPTWPYAGHRVPLVPKITIDHVLVNGDLTVRDVDAVTVPDTDHRALIATVVVPFS